MKQEIKIVLCYRQHKKRAFFPPKSESPYNHTPCSQAGGCPFHSSYQSDLQTLAMQCHGRSVNSLICCQIVDYRHNYAFVGFGHRVSEVASKRKFWFQSMQNGDLPGSFEMVILFTQISYSWKTKLFKSQENSPLYHVVLLLLIAVFSCFSRCKCDEYSGWGNDRER